MITFIIVYFRFYFNKTIEIVPESAVNGTSTEHEAQPTDSETKSELDEVEEVVNEQEQKYWKTVMENPGDFTSWTYLLQFVEQEVCTTKKSRKKDLEKRNYKRNSSSCK